MSTLVSIFWYEHRELYDLVATAAADLQTVIYWRKEQINMYHGMRLFGVPSTWVPLLIPNFSHLRAFGHIVWLPRSIVQWEKCMVRI